MTNSFDKLKTSASRGQVLASHGDAPPTWEPYGDWVKDNADMHEKFGVNSVVRSMDAEKLCKFLEFRLNFLQEELDEAKKATRAEDVVDAMIDLCVVAIGTLNAFDVDAYEAWNRVHSANMQKEPGIKKERPNPLGLPDLIKPAGWTAPTHANNVGMLNKTGLFNQPETDILHHSV